MNRTLALRIAAACLLISTSSLVLAQTRTEYEDGLAARRNGRDAEAIRLLSAWLAHHPEDTDARVQLAFSELALGRLDAAERNFRAVLVAAPAYADASTGLDLVAKRRNQGSDRTLIALEGSLGDVRAGPDWKEIGLLLATPVSSSTTLEGRANWYRRFSLSDVEAGALLTTRVADDVWLRAGIAGTPGADFRPRIALTGGIDWRLTHGDTATVLTFDARHEDFPAQHVTTIIPGITQYLAGDRAWITVRGFGVSPQGQDMRFGFLVRGDVQPGDQLRLFVGIAEGPDTDLGVVTDVTSIFGGAEILLSDRFSLTGAVSRDTRAGPADRTDIRVGIKARL